MDIVELQGIIRGFNSDLPPNIAKTLTVSVDGNLVDHGRAVGRASDLTSDDLVSFFYNVQLGIIEHEVLGAWPRCPVHGNHPLRADAAGWICDSSNMTWSYGELTQIRIPPEPPRADGEVRWTLGGIGVIAHHDGDLWFRNVGARLREGQRVDFEEDAPQGNMRAAKNVRPI